MEGNLDLFIKRTPNYLYSVYFTDANTGYAVGEGGTILKTTNGGGTFPLKKPYHRSQHSQFILTRQLIKSSL